MKMEGVIKYDLCSEELDSVNKINVHTEGEHERVHESKKKNFGCNMCAHKCSTVHDLMRHTRTHTGERPFKCKFADCTMAFKLQSTLNGHIKFKHSDERPFKCNFPGCLHTAKTSQNLTLHKKQHSARQPCTTCPDDGCSFRAERQEAIGLDIKCVHTQTKTFDCNKCDYKTARRCNLKRHMLRHSTRSDFKCSHPQCTVSFRHSSSLKRHLKNHHEGKNIQCDSPGCEQFFSTKKALKEHLKLHNPSSRPFQCPLCFHYFCNLDELQMHCFVHTNEKPFECGHCEFAAVRQAVVQRHISSAHASVEFPFVVHLLDDRECLRCKVILPSAEFLVHSKGHKGSVVTM